MKWYVLIISLLVLLLTVQGAVAFSWWGLFPEKVITPDVQFKTEPATLLDRLNNFFLQHKEFRNLPEGTSIGLAVDNSDFLVTEKGIRLAIYRSTAEDANIWVSQSFLERLLSVDDLCGFLNGLKLSPEDGVSYGLYTSRNWLSLRWKFGGGNTYCPGSDLWP